MSRNNNIDYLEYPAKDLEATKAFFAEVFSWSFTDYGPEYTAFHSDKIEGGFYLSNLCSSADQGAALTVFYSDALEALQEKVEAAGGHISKEMFSFPGGKRFHFLEPSGNEFAVWTET